ncbi:MAG: type II secretion system protein GspD [Trueperaceae bacterium]
MKKLSILFTLLLALVASAFAQLPDEERFKAPITLETQVDGESLRSVVDVLARSVGLTPVIDLDDEMANKSVIYKIDQEKPFNQIWDVVMKQEGLDYVLQANDVVVIGTPESIAGLGGAPVELEESVEQKVYPVTKDPEEIADIVTRVVPGVEAEALPGVGSILVRGTAEQHTAVDSALRQFGATSALDSLEQRIFQLSNAKAVDVAAALQNILLATAAEQAPAAVAVEGEEGGLQGAGDLRYSVVAYEPTNTVIVRATPSILAQVEQLMPNLDSAQPQVNVQVRIQEITTSAAEELGVNLAAGLGNFSTTLLDGGLNFVFDAQQALSGLNLGATLDTLERQQLSRRVDDASVTVANNTPGFIQSGGTIYVLLPGSTENIERVIEYGVKISVTPRITADGRIAMDVEAQLDEPEGTVENPNLLELTNRKVATTVTVEPGQTILLGGLFSNRFNSTVEGVPFLSSIPIIGSAFTTTRNSKDNIDLFLVLTADVLD